jgi:hypothetical protein
MFTWQDLVMLRFQIPGWCNLFKFDARIGGGVVCPNAAAELLAPRVGVARKA